jgi:uncharacterized protein YijF (DUF1287 family)
MRAIPVAVVAACVCPGWWLPARAQVASASASAPGPPSVHDVGIFSDLDDAVRVTLPRRVDADKTRLRIDEPHRAVVLYEGDFPLKIYALAGAPPAGPVSVASVIALLGPADAAEVSRTVSGQTVVDRIAAARDASLGDSDRDGIPDPLDILMGARKLVLNRAKYTEGYFQVSYPGGDVPRAVGVCSDTVIRAYRNAGIDLQSRVAEDIRAAPAAYPAIHRPNTSIDHRRVKTLLTWFLRHVPQVREGPTRPGDVVFLDTFSNRPGPEHVGIISDRTAPSGLPFVINNWTVGYEEGEMDLLPSIAVTHRFRMKAK